MQFDVAKHCSEPLTAKKFRDDCLSKIGDQAISRHRREITIEDVIASQNTDLETANELATICDPANLRCPLEDKFDITDNESLKTLPLDQCPLKSVELTKSANKRSSVVNYMFHIWEAEENKADDNSETDLEDGTVLLSVMLYHPVKQSKEQGYLVLANQYKNRSGFFFIEGVFYNDTRDPMNRDYSEEIMEWAKQSFKRSSKKLGSFSSKKMEDIKFKNLQIRLGYPYYYCHQGNCEHLMIFTDMRLLHGDDPQLRKLYPYRIYKKMPKRIKCSICDINTAMWITTDDILAFEDPSYFCQSCFDLLHYDEDKRKLHEFNAYRFDGNYAP